MRVDASIADFEAALRAGGLSETAASPKAAILRRCGDVLAAFGVSPDASVPAFFIPGRIEVFGKHTDYCGGRSLLAAVERGFCAMASPRNDRVLRITDIATKQSCEFEITPELVPPLGNWSNYPMTVARRVARNFPGELRGADVAFASDLPPASGMSSSSAMIVLFFLILSKVNQLTERPEYQRNIHSPEELAGYLGTVENGQSFGDLAGDKGVGTFGGSEDHTAILCCRAGFLSQYSFCPVRLERQIAMPSDHCFALGVSGVVAEKTGDALEKYNRVSLMAAEVLRLWNISAGRKYPHLAAVVRQPGGANEVRELIKFAGGSGGFAVADLYARIAQFELENEKTVLLAADALAASEWSVFGNVAESSQGNAEDFLANQVPETIFLARSARKAGADAASAFGAGFGGSVWAMVRRDRAESFLTEWRARYQAEFPQRVASTSFFLSDAGPAALQLDPQS